MNIEELKTYKKKTWCTTQDFMKIGQCGRNTALKKMKMIRNIMQMNGYIVPNNRYLPMKRVLEYLGIGE